MGPDRAPRTIAGRPRPHGGSKGVGIEAEGIAHEADGHRDLVVERAEQPGGRERLPGRVQRREAAHHARVAERLAEQRDEQRTRTAVRPGAAFLTIGGCGVAGFWTVFAPMASTYTVEAHKLGMQIFWSIPVVGLVLAIPGGWARGTEWRSLEPRQRHLSDRAGEKLSLDLATQSGLGLQM